MVPLAHGTALSLLLPPPLATAALTVSFSHSFVSFPRSSVYLHVISSWPLVGDEKIYFIGAKRRDRAFTNLPR